MSGDTQSGRTPSARLSDCEHALRITDYISTEVNPADEESFVALNPVPLTYDKKEFRATVERLAARHNLRVHETDSPFRFVVAVPNARR